MQYLVGDYPLLWWPVNLLEYAGQMVFNVFFLTFPDGRFVPRWTRWIAVMWAVLFVPYVFLGGTPLDTPGTAPCSSCTGLVGLRPGLPVRQR